MTSTQFTEPTIILIPGYWLGSWAWEEVRKILTAVGINFIDSVEGEVVLAGHSGAHGPVSLILDRNRVRSRASGICD